MIYFALRTDGLIHNLGDHGDFEAADCTAQDMQIDPIWIFYENDARTWADYITTELAATETTG